MRTKATLPIVALMALLVFGAGAAIAGGESKDVGTELTAEYKKGTADNPYVPSRDPAFKGTVKSKSSACEEKRKVKIKGVGADKTDAKGRFEIDASKADAGTYKVKVAQKQVSDGGKTIVCSSAKAKVKVKAGSE